MSYLRDLDDPVMVCPGCDIDLVPGYSVDPRSDYDSLGPFDSPLRADQVEIVFTAKCMGCGHQEYLRREYQSKLMGITPPGYTNWNAYWRDTRRELPAKWLASVLLGNLDSQ